MVVREKSNSRRFLKRLASLIFATVISTNILITSLASTGAATYDTNMDYRIEINSSERFPKSIYIQNRTLVLDKVPLISIYNYIWLILKDNNGKEVYSNIVKNNTGTISFYLDNISEGKYSVNLFAAAERYTKYKSLIYGKDIEVLFKNGNLSFVTYPYYSHNMAVVNNKRTDEKALSYYRQPSGRIQSDNQEIIDIANSITSGIDNDYDKAVAIHDWVCNNIYYDRDSYLSKSYLQVDFSALGTLHSRRAVCEGYSNLTTALLRAAGVPAKKVTGFALGVSNDYWPENLDLKKDSNHSWNEFWANGRWIIIDTTWDSGNKWENGAISENEGLRGYHYFDINVGLFSADHVIEDYNESDVPQP